MRIEFGKKKRNIRNQGLVFSIDIGLVLVFMNLMNLSGAGLDLKYSTLYSP